jgi:sterol desaturase/sphingolipid hydroxylase (fatty acid hydroxylase superfamily)
MELLIQNFDALQSIIFEKWVEPLAFFLGLGGVLEQLYDATGWFLVGCAQLIFMLCILLPLEYWRPVEAVTDHAEVHTDMVYTMIHRLGIFRLLFFFLLQPLVFQGMSWWSLHDWPTLNLESLWPGISDQHLFEFFIYLVVFDFIAYWLHRAQHFFPFWWALHAVHHSQRQMTLWSDNRNHLLDDVFMALIWSLVVQVFGVPPGQFVALVAIGQCIESLQHANIRMNWGNWGRWVLISPHFHRIHHAAGLGHESAHQKLGGHNFGVLFPWWDMFFKTANFNPIDMPTGIRDQIENGRDYGRGFWQQQFLGFGRLFKSAPEQR